jgi:nucleoside phosphorylase
MEGAALALACQRFQVPFTQLRGISNLVGAPRGDWRFREAGEHAQRAALALLGWDSREASGL